MTGPRTAPGPPPAPRSRWEALFSTANHPRRVITDPTKRRRYQRRRLIVAVLGSLVGGAGLGLSFSHSGLIGAEIVPALWAPMAIGLVLAAIFVWVPLPPIVQWLTTIALVVVSMALLRIGVGWQIGLGFIGFAISWVVAVVLQFGIGVVGIWARDLVTELSVIAAIVVLVVADPIPSAAQTGADSGLEPCPAERLQIEVDGDRSAFAPDRGEPLTIDVDGDRVSIPVIATSELSRGTVVIELVETEPLGVLQGRRAVVWTGELSPAGGGGSTGPSEIEIFRPSGSSTYRIAAEAHDADIGLLAGQGRYRATVTDPFTGTSCRLDAVIRITASPLDTIPGRIGLAGAVLGLGLATASLLGGSVRPASSRRDRADDALGALRPPRIRLFDQRSRTSADGTRTEYQIVLQLRIDDDDENAYKVEVGQWHWTDSIPRLGVAGTISGPGTYTIPIELATDPKKVRFEIASFDVDLVGPDNMTMTVGSLRLPTSSTTWRLETIGAGEMDIDLRGPARPPWVPDRPVDPPGTAGDPAGRTR